MQSHELEAIIRAKVEGVEKLVVSDVSGGCGQAFDVIIVSPVFEGLPTLKRHRMVNDLLKEQIAQLHAFSQKTYTPAQYETLSGKSFSSSSSSAPAAAATSAPAPAAGTDASLAKPFSFGSLAAPSTPPTKSRSSAAASAAHNRTASNVSIPELTLTTDDETLSGKSAHGAPRPLTPSAQPGGTTSALPDMHASPQSPAPSISRLHYSKISSPEFWEGLRGYLESQLITNAPGSPAAVENSNPLASPSANSNSNHVRGEAELIRLFEEFLQSQKPHLSASDVAKVRDGTGMFGM
ncbi:unnamed protein product [Sympodiomycopsis kandeliae]